MTDHPITPPPELVGQWREEAAHRQYGSVEADEHIAEQAAQWGADQELEACCEVMRVNGDYVSDGVLRAIRRPKPPSLKEQALKALTAINSNFCVYEPDASIIRRALEQLTD